MALHRLPLSGFSANVMDFTRDKSRWDLNPPYQRGSVWNDDQRRMLIHSLMIGLPIGAITLSLRDAENPHPDPNVQGVVVDGKQRITTLRAFHDNEFTVPARWFENDPTYNEGGIYLPDGVDLDGMVHYRDLTDLGQRLWFRSCTVTVVEAVGLDTAAEADLYLAINFAGVAQTDDDYARAAAIANGAPT